MPLLDLTHLPPDRPAVVDESVKDTKLVCFAMKIDSDRIKSVNDNFGSAGPILSRWLWACSIINPMQGVYKLLTSGSRKESGKTAEVLGETPKGSKIT